ncbi:MAG: NAD+ synthase, partial [Candidatus Omnitrophica bacterium]|nr:NAD+ synthase [Candidatus Omnitrophota bacterium]
VKRAKAKGVVIGLSGGIDSSVTAILAKEALGENLIALILPCKSSKEDLEDAKLIAKKFKLKTKIVDLSKIYDILVNQILPKGNRISYANLKARLRMLVLYYFANKLNYLVCGTGNKSEINVGYFTKYGDGATDILPLGDLLKFEVRILAKDLGIPKKVVNKKPSAGLWPGQTDEGEMGITYKDLDDILLRMEKNKRQILSEEKVEKVKDMIKIRT